MSSKPIAIQTHSDWLECRFGQSFERLVPNCPTHQIYQLLTGHIGVISISTILTVYINEIVAV